ncbi:NHLP bacteriocin system secretion protein [Synechococcus sp. CCY9201]|uniref:NHLP bacteriocin system secretion protein n=2 Tax=unclassified Synechococcus TaxID=2626047 RepID=UPI002B220AD7|nr:NHLP bacteriocin system secretion protein [Synechococcus sp. CCY9201]MEA5475125.1 NHLP bacteriocin system secretion protein [Synechococcus sp. CCY9201]
MTITSPDSGAPPPGPVPSAGRGVRSLPHRWAGLSDHDQVGVCLAAVAGALGCWALFWPVPTEVTGQGVLVYPNNAGLLNARSGGQVRQIFVQVGDRVSRGQVLMELYLPVLEKELQQQKGNLAQLELQNRELDQRDRLRLATERLSVDTALAKLADDRDRFEALQATYADKLRNLRWLSQRQVVAPLSSEVVGAEQGFTTTSVNLDATRTQEKEVLTSYEQVKLTIDTQALQRRYQIDDLKRQVRVTEARIAFDGKVVAQRDGRLLDLQVIEGQTVSTGQRLGTLGRAAAPTAHEAPLRAVAFFAPADARRLPPGLPVEVVPLWNQRGRFGGIVGKVSQVLTLPATEEDISTTIGNPQLAQELVSKGPVMRAEIALERDPSSLDGYRWTLSRGSGVFPVRDGLTIASHAYVEWRTPISYLIPGLRSITGGYRSQGMDRRWNLPFLRQPDTLP